MKALVLIYFLTTVVANAEVVENCIDAKETLEMLKVDAKPNTALMQKLKNMALEEMLKINKLEIKSTNVENDQIHLVLKDGGECWVDVGGVVSSVIDCKLQAIRLHGSGSCAPAKGPFITLKSINSDPSSALKCIKKIKQDCKSLPATRKDLAPNSNGAT